MSPLYANASITISSAIIVIALALIQLTLAVLMQHNVGPKSVPCLTIYYTFVFSVYCPGVSVIILTY